MLPFTKRPGRDESADEDLVTKDAIVVPAATASASKGRGKFPSLNDEEMTTLMGAKSLGDARPSVRPAAGAPPPSRAVSNTKSVPPPAKSVPPPAKSSRSGKFAAQDDDGEGRTVVRGAPKIVKRGGASANKMGMPTGPTTISPAAVIKATLESARAGAKSRTGGDLLMAGPPQDLLEDLADRHAAEPHPADVGAERTAILQSPSVAPPPMIQGVKALPTQMLQPQQQVGQGTIPPGSARPMSVPPPPNSHGASQSGGYSTQSGGYATQSGGYATQSGGYATQSGGYATQSGGYGAQLHAPVPSGSVSVPGVSMPAHFMMPQPPYSDGRIDPPGTAMTAKSAGRPAMSWAMALAAFGLFVGVGAVAVMNGNADGVVETSASFVDPSRAAAGGKAAAAQAAAQAAAPVAAPTGVPVGTEPPAPVGVPPVAVLASPPAVATTAAPVATVAAAAAPVATVPAVTAPPAPPAVVAAAPAAAPVAVAVAAPQARPAPVAAAPQPRPAPVAAAPVSRPARPPQPAADEPAAAPKPTKGKPGKGGGEVDDETKKALDELQKAQLERSF